MAWEPEPVSTHFFLIMTTGIANRLLADFVLLLHAAVAGFIVLGLALVVLGGLLGWRWVRNPWFRWIHLIAIGVVIAEEWLGAICPLTTLETYLRLRAGNAVYQGSFIAHWIEALLYYRAPAWVFTVGYTAFGLLVVASWFIVRPRRSNEPY